MRILYRHSFGLILCAILLQGASSGGYGPVSQTEVCEQCPGHSYATSSCVTNPLNQCACEVGYFRGNSNSAACVPCLSCGSGAFEKTNCVQNAADVNQCGCSPGFQLNSVGNCVAIAPTCLQCPEHSYATSSCVTNPLNQCACGVGYFRGNPNSAACVPCLSCGAGAYAKTNCVQNAADANQCVCSPGFLLNSVGNCVSVAPTCLQCGANQQPKPGVTCVTNTNTQCECISGYFSHSGTCKQCNQCPANSQTNLQCVTDIAAQCFCSSGYQGTPPYCVTQTQICQQCPYNLVKLADCVTNTATQCACPTGTQRQNGQFWCLPTPAPVPTPVASTVLMPQYPTVPAPLPTASASIPGGSSGKGKGKGKSSSRQKDSLEASDAGFARILSPLLVSALVVAVLGY